MRHRRYLMIAGILWCAAPAMGQTPEQSQSPDEQTPPERRLHQTNKSAAFPRGDKPAKTSKGGKVNIRATVDVIDPRSPVEDIFSIIQKRENAPPDRPERTNARRVKLNQGTVKGADHGALERRRDSMKPRANEADTKSRLERPVERGLDQPNRWQRRSEQLQRRRGRDPRGAKSLRDARRRRFLPPGERRPNPEFPSR